MSRVRIQFAQQRANVNVQKPNLKLQLQKVQIHNNLVCKSFLANVKGNKERLKENVNIHISYADVTYRFGM